MAVLKLEALVQSVLAREVVVAGSERCGTRLADRATPTFLPFGWLPSTGADADPNPPLVNHGQPVMYVQRGLRAGRSAGLSGSSRSRHLSARHRRHGSWRLTPAPRVPAMTSIAALCAAIASRGLKPTAVN